jgi:WD40 repeat protein/predicted negative regulator of RcsB-dependent stress response
VYESLSKDQQLIAKRIFLELTQLGEGTEDTRRQVFKQEFINDELSQELVEQVMTQLADARLLVTSQLRVRGESEATLTVVDVAHEALIRHWTRLRQWLNENREVIRKERKIEEAAQEWQENRRRRDYLLQGAKLTEAENYCQDYADLGLLSRLAQDFIQQSIKQRRQNRLLRIGSAVAVFGVVTTAAIVSTSLWLRAEKQIKIVQLREKAARVQNLLPIEPVEALVLAIQGMGESLSSSPEVRQQVFSEVQFSLYDAMGNAKERTILRRHQGGVSTVAYSPDGTKIVSGGADGTVRLWNHQGKPIGLPFKGHQGWVNSVAFSPNGKQIVSGGADGTVRLWNHQGKPIGLPFKGHQSWVTSVAFSPNGKQIVSGNLDGTLRLWDSQGKPIGQPWRGHQNRVTSVAFSPDGKQIVSSSYDGTLRLWDSQGKPIGLPFKGHQDKVTSVAFSPNGKQIVSGGNDMTVRLWDSQGKPIGQPWRGHQGWVTSVAFSPDGKQIVSSSNDMTVRLWDSQGKPIGQPLRGHQGLVLSVAFSPDGKQIVSSSNDGTLKLWDSQGKPIGLPFKGHQSRVYSVAFSPDGKQIVSGGNDKTVRLWDSQGKPIGQPLRGHQGLVLSVAFSPDSKQIVSGSDDGTIRLWDSQGKPIGQPLNHQGEVYAVAFSPNGEQIVSGSEDGTIRLWDSQGKPIGQPLNHQGGVRAVAFSPDGKRIVSGGMQGTVRLWNKQGQPISQPFKAHRDRVLSVAFSPDGKQIVSGGAEGTVRLWNKQGQPISQPLTGHQSGVYPVTFSPDSKQIVSSSTDGTVRLWDRQGNLIDLLLKESPGKITSVALSPDRKRIVRGNADGTIRLWQSGSWQTWLGVACERLRNHPILIAPETILAEEPQTIEVTQAAGETCMKYAWNSIEKADFWVNQGLAIAREGNVKDAIAKFNQALNLVSEIDLNPSTQVPDNNPKAVAQKLAASAQLEKAEMLAQEGKIQEAIASYTQALEFDPEIDLNPYTDDKDNEPKAIAHQFAAQGKVEEGGRLAREGKIQEAIASYTQALKFNPDIDLNPYTEDKENDPQAVAHRFAAQSQVEKGGRLAQQGKIKEAIASYTQALKFNPDIDLNPYTEDKEKEPKAVAHKFVAQGKVWEGQSLAREGKIKEAIASYTQALNFDPDIDLNPDTDDKEKEPKAVAHTVAAMGKVGEGVRLARQGKVKEAIASYTQALKFNPDIDLNPDTEDKENDPQAVAQTLAAQAKVEEGVELARQGKIKEAIASYTQAQKLDPTLEISANSWNTICWFGSLHQQATQVMDACEKAVILEPEDGDIRNSRGLARALTGDTAGAIEDFQAFIAWTDNDNHKAKRQRWINELRAGKNPFTPEELERLLNE